MDVTIFIDREAAIRAGTEQFGEVTVDLPLAELDQADRNLLATWTQGFPLQPSDPIPLHQPPTRIGMLIPYAADAGVSLPARPTVAMPDPLPFLAWAREVLKAEQALIDAIASKTEQQVAAYLDIATKAAPDAFLFASRRERVPVVRKYEPVRSPQSNQCIELPQTLQQDTPPTAWGGQNRLVELHKRLRAHIDETLAPKWAEAEQFRAQERLKTEALRVYREAMDDAFEAEKSRFLVQWVRDHMEENAHARFKDGFLPEQEVLDALRNTLYAPLATFDRYQRVNAKDLVHSADCRWHKLNCKTRSLTSLDAAQYDVYTAIEAAAEAISLPFEDVSLAVELTPFVHSCFCLGCDVTLDRASVQVKLTLAAPITIERPEHLPDDVVSTQTRTLATFTREYALPDR